MQRMTAYCPAIARDSLTIRRRRTLLTALPTVNSFSSTPRSRMRHVIFQA
jgi:hypothetical protein